MTIQPYADAIEYVEDELTKYLPLRAARLNAERQVKELTSDILDCKTARAKHRVNLLEIEHRAKQLLELEAYTRNEIDDHLKVTSTIQGEAGFGMDRLNGNLNADARLVMLTLTATALGMGEETLGEIGMSYFGSVSVSDLMNMLNVETISDRLRVRHMLLELSGKGFIIFDYPSKQVVPEDFYTTHVAISRRAFSVILEDPSLEAEQI